MSLSANLKNHKLQIQYLNLSDEATRTLWNNKKQSHNPKTNHYSLSRALSETCLDIHSFQQVKEMIFWTRDERLTLGSSQQRQKKNVFMEDRNEMSSASGQDKTVLYFPHNRQHHYLNDVELSTEIFNDVNLRFGCPTKTSLLRSRQRAASTSALSKHLKAQILRIQLKTPAFQKAIYSERARPISEAGGDDSYYGYLTGGRYNWAHLIDGKSRSDLGLYVPRSNPQKTFFVAKINKKEKKKGRTFLGCCRETMRDEEVQVQVEKPKQIAIDLNKKEPLHFVVQPQPLNLRDVSDKVPDSDMEEPRQDPPPTPVGAYPISKEQKLTGVMTTSAVHLKEKEKSRIGLNEGVQNIWTNTIS